MTVWLRLGEYGCNRLNRLRWRLSWLAMNSSHLQVKPERAVGCGSVDGHKTVGDVRDPHVYDGGCDLSHSLRPVIIARVTEVLERMFGLLENIVSVLMGSTVRVVCGSAHRCPTLVCGVVTRPIPANHTTERRLREPAVSRGSIRGAPWSMMDVAGAITRGGGRRSPDCKEARLVLSSSAE